ncbi:hypothetical protein, partial [Microvirga roseola]|uniref:hypothetical protein n=1 Tax=Microvirga roseola TaxID=2883126 RepID=UPI001E62863D
DAADPAKPTAEWNRSPRLKIPATWPFRNARWKSGRSFSFTLGFYFTCRVASGIVTIAHDL